MPAPAVAAGAKVAAKVALQSKTGKKAVKLGCLAAIGIVLFPLFIFIMILSAIVGVGIQQAQANQDSTIQPMPDICSSLSDPNYGPVIQAAQKAVKPGTVMDATSCKKPDAGVITLLAMAWVDSQWGTSWSSALSAGKTIPCTSPPTAAPFVPIAQAALSAGFTGSNAVFATAITSHETACGTNIGPCVPNGPQGNCPGPDTTGCNSYGFCGAWQVGMETWASADYLGRWGLTTDRTQAATDLMTNAKYAFALASGGNPQASQQTIYNGLYSNWVPYDGCCTSAEMAAAQQAVNQAQGGQLPGGEAGIILMDKTKWASFGVSQPNNIASADREMQVVWGIIGTSDPPSQSAITSFYTQYGVSGIDPSLVSDHVNMIQEVIQMASGGGGNIVALARADLGDTETQVPGLCSWSHCQENWCADFATMIYHNAGVPGMTSDLPAVSQIYTWAQNSHRLLPGSATPAPGDLLLWQDGSGTWEHVDIVVAVNGSGWIQTIDGNYGSSFTTSKVTLVPSTGGFYDPKDSSQTLQWIGWPTVGGYVSPTPLG